jgi:CBF1 interacting corepressor
MVQGLAFLSKKGFNPQNQVNRKHVWEAQQASKQEQDRVRQRQEQLRREREEEELCASRHGGDGSQAQLRFMYDEPPGLSNKKEEGEEEANHQSSSSSNVVTQVQPGDDAAAAAFRRMLAQTLTNNELEQDAQEATTSEQEPKLSFGPVLQGTTLDPNDQPQQPEDKKNLSALEKAVGRRDRGNALTLEEQVARFPQLKNAPMAKGMSLTDVNVNFKPLGSQLRNIKCLACGVWGHSRGDRECSKTGWDPFSVINRPSVPTTIRPLESKAISSEKRKHRREQEEDDDASTSSSRSSSSDSRRKRKKKSRSKKSHKESKRHRRSRSESPSRRRRKSNKKKRSRDD